MKIINRFSFSSLWNSEFPVIVERILKIIQKFDPEALHIVKRYEAAVAYLPQLQLMAVQERASKLSATLSSKDDERDSLILAIYVIAKTFAHVPLSELSAMGTMVAELFVKHDRQMVRANYASETQQIRAFCADVDASSEIQAAMAAMSLTTIYEALKVCNEEFEQILLQRNTEQTSNTIDVRAIRAAAGKAIAELWDYINAVADDYPDANFAGLIAELNTLNETVRSQLKARATRRKNGARTEDEKPIELTDGQMAANSSLQK